MRMGILCGGGPAPGMNSVISAATIEAVNSGWEVVGVLDELGYAPQPDARVDRVRLTRCPLLQVANDMPEVVCNVHLGLVEELLDASGADRRRASLTPFAGPGPRFVTSMS